MPVDQQALAATLQNLLRNVDLPPGTEGQSLIEHLDRVVQAAQNVLGVDGAGLMLLDERNLLRVVGVTDDAGAALERGQQHLDLGPAIDCVRSDAVMVVPDLAESAAYAALWRWLEASRTDGEPPVRAVLSVPVRVAGSVAGTLNALGARPHSWTAEQITAVEAYAGILGVMLRLGSGVPGAATPPVQSPGGTA
ncbi:GAF domain-containing protein [Paractinoplanes maris]|uniref:GAF domain-containing protein n=1 Tax=Paractinoplanes maris TaxID=1734446 RepID=UPI0020222D08|nr:GAF domain-containing protein [Actinoplanes maris]